MLPTRYPDDFYPPSSPPSSPSGTSYFDSSPASSPGHIPAFEGEGDSSTEDIHRPIDPLSGLYVSRSGKRSAADQDITSPPSKKPRYVTGSPSTAETTPQSSPFDLLSKNRELDIWERAATRAYEDATSSKHVKIQLGDCGLTQMSTPFIRDMSNFVFLADDDDVKEELQTIRPFVRSSTTPDVFSSPSQRTNRFRTPMKAASSKSILKGEGTGMELYLATNMIQKLPAELFNWESLTVLSLRNNAIRYLPPEISKLKNLLELNVATNKLEFVPSELLSMNLTNIHLHPNPFLASNQSHLTTKRFGKSRIPTLTELGMRRLLGPPKPSSSTFEGKSLAKTLFEAHYDLPLSIVGSERKPFFPRLISVLSTCVPKSLIYDGRPDYDLSLEEGGPITGVGRCPNPSHDRVSVYICPGEERFTWERMLDNGVHVGAPVPVRWRGCMWGCLDFLGAVDEEVSGSGNVSTDGELEDVVRMVDLGDGALGFD